VPRRENGVAQQQPRQLGVLRQSLDDGGYFADKSGSVACGRVVVFHERFLFEEAECARLKYADRLFGVDFSPDDLV
jgi:hypothetical protein